MDLTQAPATDPSTVLRYRDGLYAVDLLGAAIVYFDFFSWLERNPSDLEGVCAHFGFAKRPADVMMTLFAANGFVSTNGDGKFQCTDTARDYLVSGSPWFLGPYYDSLKERPVVQDFRKVLETGRPANWGGFEDQDGDWHQAMLTDEFATGFTAAMNCRGTFLGKALADAVDLSGCEHVLDIGGGSGIYACALAANHSGLLATVLEQPPVDEIARRNIEALGFSDRVSVACGDMFAGAFPEAADVHLFSNVMHDWDEPEVRRLIEHSFATLPAGGRILVHETFLNPKKTGPLPVAEYSCILMHSTQGRCYSVKEMTDWLVEAGFRDTDYRDTAGDRGVVTASKPEV